MTHSPRDDVQRLVWREPTRYEPSISVSGQRADIRHNLYDAPELKAFIADGSAIWVTEVRSPRTLLARTERATGATQIVHLNPDEVVDGRILVPGLMAVRELAIPTELLQTPRWHREPTLQVSAGCWLIGGKPQKSKTRPSPRALGDFIYRDRFQRWQESMVYIPGDYSDQDSHEAVQARERVAEHQAELHDAVVAGAEATCTYLLDRFAWPGSQGRAQIAQSVPSLRDVSLPAPPAGLTLDDERDIARSLGECFTPAQAADPAVWALCHAIWIGDGVFGDDIKACFYGSRESEPSERGTRNFLRRTGGLPHVRRNISVLVDSPVGAAWWRWRIASQASAVAQAEGETLDALTAHEVLYPSTLWEALVMPSLRRATAINAPRARAAAVVALQLHADAFSRPARREEVKGLVEQFAQLACGYNLAVVPWQELIDTATRGLKSWYSPVFVEC